MLDPLHSVCACACVSVKADDRKWSTDNQLYAVCGDVLKCAHWHVMRWGVMRWCVTCPHQSARGPILWPLMYCGYQFAQGDSQCKRDVFCLSALAKCGGWLWSDEFEAPTKKAVDTFEVWYGSGADYIRGEKGSRPANIACSPSIQNTHPTTPHHPTPPHATPHHITPHNTIPHRRSRTTPCPLQWGSARQTTHCPLPPALWRCAEGYPSAAGRPQGSPKLTPLSTRRGNSPLPQVHYTLHRARPNTQPSCFAFSGVQGIQASAIW